MGVRMARANVGTLRWPVRPVLTWAPVAGVRVLGGVTRLALDEQDSAFPFALYLRSPKSQKHKCVFDKMTGKQHKQSWANRFTYLEFKQKTLKMPMVGI